jgi:hypothetical protein
VWAFLIIERGLRTPTGPPAWRFFTSFIRDDSGAKFSSMTRSIRSMASCCGARSTAQTSSGCSSPGVDVRSRCMRVRSQLYFRPRRQSASAQRIILPARSGVEGYGAIIESPGSERVRRSRPQAAHDRLESVLTIAWITHAGRRPLGRGSQRLTLDRARRRQVVQ